MTDTTLWMIGGLLLILVISIADRVSTAPRHGAPRRAAAQNCGCASAILLVIAAGSFLAMRLGGDVGKWLSDGMVHNNPPAWAVSLLAIVSPFAILIYGVNWLIEVAEARQMERKYPKGKG